MKYLFEFVDREVENDRRCQRIKLGILIAALWLGALIVLGFRIAEWVNFRP